MNIKVTIRELETDLDNMLEEYGDNIPEDELERFGYIQGYIDALKEVLDNMNF